MTRIITDRRRLLRRQEVDTEKRKGRKGKDTKKKLSSSVKAAVFLAEAAQIPKILLTR